MKISLFDRVENALGKGEKAGYQHFLLFPQCFPKHSPFGSIKVGIVWKRVIDKRDREFTRYSSKLLSSNHLFLWPPWENCIENIEREKDKILHDGK